MSLVLSKSDVAILRAVSLGYTATEDGRVFSPEGNEIRGSHKEKGKGHLSITLILKMGNRTKMPVLKHRFIYYYFCGSDMFKHQVVRHLNDIPHDNRLTNLKAGSHLENMRDIPKNVRSEAMTPERIKAFIERCRKLSDEDINEIRVKRREFKTPYYKLAKEYNVSTMTICRLCNGKSWANIKENTDDNAL